MYFTIYVLGQELHRQRL